MSCENCKLRARYDKKPESFLGRLWHWHAGFCPGWKGYIKGLPEEKKLELLNRYNLKYK